MTFSSIPLSSVSYTKLVVSGRDPGSPGVPSVFTGLVCLPLKTYIQNHEVGLNSRSVSDTPLSVGNHRLFNQERLVVRQILSIRHNIRIIYIVLDEPKRIGINIIV